LQDLRGPTSKGREGRNDGWERQGRKERERKDGKGGKKNHTGTFFLHFESC